MASATICSMAKNAEQIAYIIKSGDLLTGVDHAACEARCGQSDEWVKRRKNDWSVKNRATVFHIKLCNAACLDENAL